MSATPTILFTGTDVDAVLPSCSGPGTFSLKIPANSEALTTLKTNIVDLHISVTIPLGYSGHVSPFLYNDLADAVDCIGHAYCFAGTGVAFPLKMTFYNPGATVSAGALTEGFTCGYLVVSKTPDVLFNTDGTY